MSVQPLAQPVLPEETREAPRPAGDPLSDALIYLAAHHGRALSRDALIGGLPILDDRLSVIGISRAGQAVDDDDLGRLPQFSRRPLHLTLDAR